MTTTDPQSQQNSGSSPPAGTPVIADVFAVRKAGRVEFDLKWRFEGGNEARPEPIDIPQKKCGDPGTMIHFHLHDKSGSGLVFDPVHPMWVSRTECPEDWAEDSEIPAGEMTRHPKLLKVFNANQDECELYFALVFEDNDGKRVPYDPRIKNGGTV